MSDLNDVAAAYKQHQQLLAQANALNKTAVFDALAAAGISSVIVTFDGEGDSGQIEEYRCYKGDAADASRTTTIELQQAAWSTGRDSTAGISPLREAIETLCYDYLEQEHGGWENNDGAFGEFTFDVAEPHDRA